MSEAIHKRTLPWQEKLPFAPLRVIWIFCMLFLGIAFFINVVGLSPAKASLAAELAALPACLGTFSQLGARNLNGKDLVCVVIFYLGMMLMIMLVSLPWGWLIDAAGMDTPETQDVVSDIANARNLDRLYLFLSVCVITPVVEEVLFRRIIFGWFSSLDNSGVSVALGMFVTSLIFSMLHFFIRGVPSLFIMGLAFNLIYLVRKNLFAAIMLHSLVNSISFLVSSFSAEM